MLTHIANNKVNIKLPNAKRLVINILTGEIGEASNPQTDNTEKLNYLVR